MADSSFSGFLWWPQRWFGLTEALPAVLFVGWQIHNIKTLPEVKGIALGNLSLAVNKLGDRKQAIEHAEAALTIFEQIEDPSAGKVRKQIEEWGKK